MAARDAAVDLAEQALALPARARLAIASTLLDSVEASGDSEWETAWAEELVRRAGEVDRGEVALEDWEAVRERLRSDLRCP